MSEFTDQVEEKRRKGIHYKTALESFKVELKDFEGSKKERIINLANILKGSGYDEEKISEKVGDDLAGYLSKRYVREILGDEFKNKNKIRDQAHGETNKEILCGTSSATDTTYENKQPILIANNGATETETVDQKSESALDEIYGGKSFSQMKREADKEVDEDQEETLENPHNSPSNDITTQPMPLLSDKSPEFRELEARLNEAQDMISKMAEDRDTAVKQAGIWSKKFNQLKGGSINEDLTRLKVENNNLKTLLTDVDKEAIAKQEGLKDFEVLKLDPLTTSLLLDVSRKSQRTLFLLVNPKTMQIKGVKTDVQMHQFQARKAAGVV